MRTASIDYHICQRCGSPLPIQPIGRQRKILPGLLQRSEQGTISSPYLNMEEITGDLHMLPYKSGGEGKHISLSEVL